MKNQNIDEKYIEQLLSKFMEGQTTLDEEDVLAFYFRSNDVRPEWEDYKEMFAYFDRGMVEAETEKPKLRIWKPLAVAAAVAAILVMVLSPRQTSTVEEPLAFEPTPPTVENILLAETQQTETKEAPQPKLHPKRQPAQTSEEEIEQLVMQEERRMRIEMARIENDIAESYGEMLIAEYMLERQIEGEAQELPKVESVGGDAYYIPHDNIMTFIMP